MQSPSLETKLSKTFLCFCVGVERGLLGAPSRGGGGGRHTSMLNVLEIFTVDTVDLRKRTA